jgi:uncharacterized membrane protein HdeD (DUF308 family)
MAMGPAKTLLHQGNPLRSDARWEFVLIEGILALGIGLYILLAETHAQRDIVLLIGVFLLFDGLSRALAGFRLQKENDPQSSFLLIRSGIGIATGLIVVLNRFAEFMGIDAARIVASLGLIGMGITTIVGVAMARDERGIQPGAMAGAFLLVLWGAVMFYQVSNDDFATDLLGWTAIVVGAGLCGFALYRRRSEGEIARKL